MDNHTDPQTTSEEPEITLRCNKCNRPITPAEAVLTPTGYRCKDCVRDQQKVFDTSKTLDYVWAFLAAAIVSFLGSLASSFVGFYTFLLAPVAGVAVAEVVRFITHKRRSSKLFKWVTAGVILGGLPLIAINLLDLLIGLSAGAFSLYSLLPLGYQVLYLVLAVPSAYYRLSGRRRR
jgi:hypothetical protein